MEGKPTPDFPIEPSMWIRKKGIHDKYFNNDYKSKTMNFTEEIKMNVQANTDKENPIERDGTDIETWIRQAMIKINEDNTPQSEKSMWRELLEAKLNYQGGIYIA